MALSETNWIRPHHECPFYASPNRLAKDAEILAKAIKEGRVKNGETVLLAETKGRLL